MLEVGFLSPFISPNVIRLLKSPLDQNPVMIIPNSMLILKATLPFGAKKTYF
jgi:hypothetical protein